VVNSWQLQQAREQLGKVLEDAQQGPQVITRRGTEVAVVLSISEYQKLLSSREKLSEFFRNSPMADEELDFTRDKSPIRGESVL
jgi:antitoxin Phd